MASESSGDNTRTAADSGRIEFPDPEPLAREALHRARVDAARMDPAEYLAFLQSLPHAMPEELRRRPTFRGEPFRLS